MRTFITCLLLVVFVWTVTTNENSAIAKSKDDPNLLRVYEVNRKVSDFPDKEDFSTPEAAYVVINRVMAGERLSGPVWQRISVERNANLLMSASKVVRHKKYHNLL